MYFFWEIVQHSMSFIDHGTLAASALINHQTVEGLSATLFSGNIHIFIYQPSLANSFSLRWYCFESNFCVEFYNESCSVQSGTKREILFAEFVITCTCRICNCLTRV